MRLKCDVSLCIFSSELTAEAIGAHVGIHAERQIVKGSQRGKSPILQHAEHVWIVTSKADEGSPVEEHVASLRNQLKGYETQIRSLQPSCTVQCSCLVRSSFAPSLHCGSDLIEWLANIGASLDIDLYISEEDQE